MGHREYILGERSQSKWRTEADATMVGFMLTADCAARSLAPADGRILRIYEM